MKNVKFYEEFDDDFGGNCIAVLTDHKASFGMVNTLSALYYVPDSAVSYGEISTDYLVKRCKPISEKSARKNPSEFVLAARQKGKSIIMTKQKRTKILRLLQLADYLEKKVPKENFDMRRWGGTYLLADRIHCGSSACAGGYACDLFHDLGLRTSSEGPRYIKLKDADSYPAMTHLEKFFGIMPDETEWLFSGIGKYSPKTPKQWAARARKLVKKKLENQ